MLSTILVYVSLFLQVAAAVIAISLFKRTKFNASWILISVGFLLMVVSRVFDLWPTIYPEMEDELAIVQKILAFIIALVLLIGVFYIGKFFNLCEEWMRSGANQRNGYWQRLSARKSKNGSVLRKSCTMGWDLC
ncbi:MAG: hypothetical protein ACLR5I_07445 [Odoribacter splanchnicus]